MSTLVIQSVFPKSVLLLLDSSGKMLSEKTWGSNKDEVQKLPPTIEALLKEVELGWYDVKKIVIAVGIGNFSSTRISVTMANVLAMVTNAKLYELKLDEELSPTELHKLVLQQLELGWDSVKIAQPVYKTAPMITPSKKKKFNT